MLCVSKIDIVAGLCSILIGYAVPVHRIVNKSAQEN